MKYLYSLICALVCAPVCFTNYVTANTAIHPHTKMTAQQKQAKINAYNHVFASNPQFSGYHMNNKGKTINASGVEVKGMWKQLPPAAKAQIHQADGR